MQSTGTKSDTPFPVTWELRPNLLLCSVGISGENFSQPCLETLAVGDVSSL